MLNHCQCCQLKHMQYYCLSTSGWLDHCNANCPTQSMFSERELLQKFDFVHTRCPPHRVWSICAYLPSIDIQSLQASLEFAIRVFAFWVLRMSKLMILQVFQIISVGDSRWCRFNHEWQKRDNNEPLVGVWLSWNFLNWWMCVIFGLSSFLFVMQVLLIKSN